MCVAETPSQLHNPNKNLTEQPVAYSSIGWLVIRGINICDGRAKTFPLVVLNSTTMAQSSNSKEQPEDHIIKRMMPSEQSERRNQLYEVQL